MPVMQQSMLRDAGVVGAGGAGFPTYAKTAGTAEIVLGNGAECEPLLRVDQGLMEHCAGEVARGLRLAADLVQAPRRLIGLKAKHKRAGAALEAAGVEIVGLPDFYPIGDEHLLVYEMTGRLVPQAGLPLDVGVVTQNIETLVNVARAAEGRPVIDTYVTVVGEVAQGREICAPVGMRIRDVIAACGGATVEPFAVIEGGPMMGFLVDDIDRPVTKTTKGLIVVGDDHPLPLLKRSAATPNPRALKITQSACCQCHICTDLCPRFLLGHTILPDRSVGNLHMAKGDAQVLESAALCTQCNLCGYFACPLRLFPSEVHANVKRMMARLELPPHKAEKRVTVPPPYRDFRRVPSRRLLQRLWLERYERPLIWDENSYEPADVAIRLLQHIGAPARPEVRVGDRVLRGDRIADVPADQLGVPVHASIDGRVVAVDEVEITIAA
jgi:Na+-translocating ferredoxin:NAD+ oxidoreductase RnfC subunit